MKETLKKLSDLGAMKALEVGEKISFPIAKMSTIRSNASNINTLRLTKSVVTEVSRENATITVTRIA